MVSDKLILGLAGNVPYYDDREYLNPSWIKRIKQLFLDYRCISYNNPVGKGAHFLYLALEEYAASGKSDVELKMWGSVHERYTSLADEEGISEFVEISGFIPKTESLAKLASCDVLVLTLSLGVGEYPPFSLPGKMFDYFHVGKPILALVEESYCAQVLKESGLAVVVDPRDTDAIVKAFEDFVLTKTELGGIYRLKEGFMDSFGHTAMVNQMADVFDSIS